jgi:hypothetical protein
MPYVVLVHATFDNKADADHIYNQAKTVVATVCGDGCTITEVGAN